MNTAVVIRRNAVCNAFKPAGLIVFLRLLPARRFIKFCLVGGSGLGVDMAFLFLLADPRCLGLNILFSKICAAEVAMLNNFVWNELWTFRANTIPGAGKDKQGVLARHGRGRRFLVFNAICGVGIALAVLLLHFFYDLLGWNLYISNLAAIILVTLWNFALNARWNWRQAR